MDRYQFERQLTHLRKIVLDGVSYFIVWQALNKEYDDSKQYFHQDKGFWYQFSGFFAPARKALLWSTLIQLSKAFDKDTRNVSFGKLLKIALENRKELVPHATRSSLRAILNKIENNTLLLQRLRRYRNKRLAHFDSELTEDIELPSQEVQTLVEETKSIFNSLKYSCDGKYDDFKDIMEDVYLHTSQVISIMKDAIKTSG